MRIWSSNLVSVDVFLFVIVWLPSQFAIENGAFILDLPIRNSDFPVRYVNVYQRVISTGSMFAIS